MPSKNSIIKPRELDIRKIEIRDVSDSHEQKDIGNGKVIEFPYLLELVTFNDNNKEVSLTVDPSQSVLEPKEWSKKFYTNKDGYTAFTRNHELTAVYQILKNKDQLDISEEGFDVNSLIGKFFEGVVVINDNYKFVDWIDTFKHNDINVPDLNSKKTNQEETEEESIDPNDLPF